MKEAAQPLQPSPRRQCLALPACPSGNLFVFPLQLSDSLGSQVRQADLQERPPLEQGGYGCRVTTPEGQCLLLQKASEADALMGATLLKPD